MNQIGRSVKRIEDRPLLTGRSEFAADINFENQLHMRMVRSSVASGRIIDINTETASHSEGVVAVWTAADVADVPPIDFRMTEVPGLRPYRQPILADQFVRYVGEPVAVVFAEDPYLAEDAADLVFVDYEERPVSLDASQPGIFHPDLPAEPSTIEKGYGDVDSAFADAEVVLELQLAIGRHTGVPLETRGAIGVWDGETLRMYGAAKVPHYNRDAIANMLGVQRVHLHEGHVGGGFGIRGELYPEDVLVCRAALKLGRPVKWIEDRREHMVAANHSRQQVHRVRVAADPDGRILGIDDEFWHDQGAYVRTHAATVPDLTAALLPGPYLVPAYRAVGHIVLTNKTPAGTYRGPGRYEGTFVRERVMDALAARLGLDAVELRRRNLIPPSSMPFERGLSALGTEVVYDSGDYSRLLDSVLEHIEMDRLASEVEKMREEGRWVGVGLGMFVEKSGLGPFDEVRVQLDPDGSIEVTTGVASIGQGVETAMAQVCADVLDAPVESISVIHGQTDRIARGMGAFATRTTVMTGSATLKAARVVRAQVLEFASELLEAAADDLEIVEGRVHVIGSPSGPSVTLAEVATFASPTGIGATDVFETKHMAYPYGVHLAVVEVDKETFSCRLLRFVVGYDVGRSVNPMLVCGQLAGAAAQGIGGALFEEFRYDDQGQPLATTFMDYLLPTLSEMPFVEMIVTEDSPSPLNPLGVKGAGEGGITAAGAAVASAVDQALGIPGLVSRLPISPDRLREATWDRATREAGGTRMR